MAILLLYASSAAAECAWMLWEAVEVHTFGSSALPTTKTAWEARERAFGTYGDCAGAAQKRAKEQAAVSKTAHSGHRDHSDRSIVITEIGGS